MGNGIDWPTDWVVLIACLAVLSASLAFIGYTEAKAGMNATAQIEPVKLLPTPHGVLPVGKLNVDQARFLWDNGVLFTPIR